VGDPGGSRDGPPHQPIVLFGGFLTNPLLMRGFWAALGRATGLPIFLVPARSHDWMLSVSRSGWARLLRYLDRTVQRALTESSTGKVTLVGHSAAGVVSRLYLSPEPFGGCSCAGFRVVDHLITLGTPHRSEAMYEAQVRQWVDARYPGAYFAPDVSYSSICGKFRQGRRHGNFWERLAYRSYGALTGQSEDWGDGIVPLSSALLAGARHVVLEGAAHFWGLYGFRVPWYGTQDCISRWWSAAWSGLESSHSHQVVV
jgi:hypothetical protein